MHYFIYNIHRILDLNFLFIRHIFTIIFFLFELAFVVFIYCKNEILLNCKILETFGIIIRYKKICYYC